MAPVTAWPTCSRGTTPLIVSTGAGDDKLVGRGGADRLVGGTGKDLFDINLLSDSRATAPDVIVDFAPGSDRIDLATLDANAALPGDQALRFMGGAPFTGQRGEVRTVASATQTVIQADLTGDRQHDLVVILERAVTLSASDFVL